MLTYDVGLVRADAHGSEARTKQAHITIDSDVAGRVDAFNPAELLLAAVGACMMKNIERVAPIIGFKFRGVHIELHGERQDSPPRMLSIQYRITVDTDEPDERLALLHHNVRKFGTVYNTVAPGTMLRGSLERVTAQSPVA
jgi:uncharacterized OsmC-like protein